MIWPKALRLCLVTALSLTGSGLFSNARAWDEKPLTAADASGSAPQTVTTPATAAPATPELLAPIPQTPPAQVVIPQAQTPITPAAPLKAKTQKREFNWKDHSISRKLAREIFLDRIAAADPDIIAAITNHRKSAWLLAQHPHLDKIADHDHYLCRRLTRWREASWELVKNPHADHVITLDPEGMYRAIKMTPGLARQLTLNPMFTQMINDNPDLGVVIAKHM